ncbi:MAG: hypothetical protein R6X02_03970 [Enhygromyxa sp.]
MLHSVGMFLSYERYPEALRRAAELAASAGPLRALVAGVESEESARAFIEALTPARLASVDFVDWCETPLRRIRSAVEASDPRVNCVHTNVLTDDWVDRPYAMIVGDSFIKQFSFELKPRVIERLARGLGPGGVLVLREYFGELDGLLDQFWSTLQRCLRACGWAELAPQAAQQVLETRIPELSAFMNQRGSTYREESDFLAVLDTLDLVVLECDKPRDAAYSVFVIGRRADWSRR